MYRAPDRFWFRLCGFLALSLSGHSAVISLSNLTATRGQTLIAPISFASEGQAVSSLQFDIAWDQGLTLQVVISDALRKSSKNLYTVLLSPRLLRCLIVGLDDKALGDGEILKSFIGIPAGSSGGTAQIRLTGAIAATPDGESVAVRAAPATLQIQEGSGNRDLLAEGVLNAASLLPGAISPGEIVTLFGSIPSTTPDVLFNKLPSPILYADLSQVNAVVPFGLTVDSAATLEVRALDQEIASLSIPVLPVTPAIFTQGGTGAGAGAILNEDYSLNSSSNPAAPGSIIMVFGTGFGALQPAVAEGQPADKPAVTKSLVTASIAGIPADVIYAGAAPGLIAGMIQVNIRVPATPSAHSAPIKLKVESAETPAGVTVFIQ